MVKGFFAVPFCLIAALAVPSCTPLRLGSSSPPPTLPSYAMPPCDLGHSHFDEPPPVAVMYTADIMLPRTLDVSSHRRDVKLRSGSSPINDTTPNKNPKHENKKDASQLFDLYLNLRVIPETSGFVLVRVFTPHGADLIFDYETDAAGKPKKDGIQGVAARSDQNRRDRVLCSNYYSKGSNAEGGSRELSRFYVDIAAFRKEAGNNKDAVYFNIWTRLGDNIPGTIIIDPAVRNEG